MSDVEYRFCDAYLLLIVGKQKEKRVGLLGKGRHNTSNKGEISESAIVTRLLQCGYVVLMPYGGNQRYDLVIEDANEQFWRIQCKSAWIDEKSASSLGTIEE